MLYCTLFDVVTLLLLSYRLVSLAQSIPNDISQYEVDFLLRWINDLLCSSSNPQYMTDWGAAGEGAKVIVEKLFLEGIFCIQLLFLHG